MMGTLRRPYKANHTFYMNLNHAQQNCINYWNLLVWLNHKTRNIKGIRKLSTKNVPAEWRNGVYAKCFETIKSRFCASMQTFFTLRRKGDLKARPPSYFHIKEKGIGLFQVPYRESGWKFHQKGKYLVIRLSRLGSIKVKLDYPLDLAQVKQIRVDRDNVFIVWERGKAPPKTPLGIITGEDLNVKEMDTRENGRPKMLVKHNYDTGYSLFRQRLINIARKEGVVTEFRDARRSSQKFRDQGIPEEEIHFHAAKEMQRRSKYGKRSLGFDFNQRFIITSDAKDPYDRIPFTLAYEKNEEKIKKAQKILSRKEEGSKNYREQNRKLAQLHATVEAERKREHERVAHILVNQAKEHLQRLQNKLPN